MESEKIKKLLGKRIKKLRETQGLTQGLVSEKSETIAEKRWSDIERGMYSIGLTTLTRIAQGLGVSIQKLFQFEETELKKKKKSFLKKKILMLEKQVDKLSKEIIFLKNNIIDLKKTVE